MLWLRDLVILAVCLLLAAFAFVMLSVSIGSYASGSDYTVSRGVTIDSERPIALLVVEAGMGVLNDDGVRLDSLRAGVASEIAKSDLSTRLSVDGKSNKDEPLPRRLAIAWIRLLGRRRECRTNYHRDRPEARR